MNLTLSKWHLGTLCTLALLLNLVFLYTNRFATYWRDLRGMPILHAEIGFNFYAFNNPRCNPQIRKFLHSFPFDQPIPYGIAGFTDVKVLKDHQWELPSAPPPIFETIGYGLILGILWKITQSLSFLDIQILQIFMYVLLMFFIYHLSLMLFKNIRTAFFCGLCHLLFFPLIWLNIQVLRDAWVYYGLLMLSWGIVYQLQKDSKWKWTSLAFFFFALCLWVRPIGLTAPFMMTIVLLWYSFYSSLDRKLCFKITALMWILTLFTFWIPFFIYNQLNYGRYFVGPLGQLLVEGWGEFENPNSYKICDRWFANYISNKYSISLEKYGSPEFDDCAKKEALEAIKTYKLAFFLTLVKRIPQIIFPELPWFDPPSISYFSGCSTLIQKFVYACTSLKVLLYLFWYKIFLRILFLIGYMGIYLLYKRSNHFSIILLLIGTIASSWSMIISHFEPRYLVGFYWPVFLFAGVFLEFIWQKIGEYFIWKQAPHKALQPAI